MDEKPLGSSVFTEEIKAHSLTPVKNVIDYEKLGLALVERAEDEQSEAAKENVLAGVQAILRDIAAQRKVILAAEQRIAKQQSRIDALKAGKFKIDVIDQRVQFDDDSLNGGGL